MTQASVVQPLMTAERRILIIEDCPEHSMLIGDALASDNYRIRSATSGPEGLNLARAVPHDVVVLDVGLPGIDGFEVCRQLRTFSDAFIVMVTGHSDEYDKLLGLSLGADDYITKPFSPRELSLRIKVLLRRSTLGPGTETRMFGDLTVWPDVRSLTVGGVEVKLTKIEYDLISILTCPPLRVHSRDSITRQIWGEHWSGEDHVIDVHVSNLRRKIDSKGSPSFIETVRSVGYRMASTRPSTAN